jgi:hypothetical protein
MAKGLFMKYFLKYLVPMLSIAVLVLCLMAAFLHRDKGPITIKFSEAFQGGIPTYFIAKGIFCSVALFLLGKLVEGLGRL